MRESGMEGTHLQWYGLFGYPSSTLVRNLANRICDIWNLMGGSTQVVVPV